MACCCTIEADLFEAEDRIAQITAEVGLAIIEIKNGQTAQAIIRLNRLSPDPDVEREKKKETELADLLGQWQKLAVPRPDFLTFAHKRRKWSAA